MSESRGLSVVALGICPTYRIITRDEPLVGGADAHQMQMSNCIAAFFHLICSSQEIIHFSALNKVSISTFRPKINKNWVTQLAPFTSLVENVIKFLTFKLFEMVFSLLPYSLYGVYYFCCLYNYIPYIPSDFG